MEYGLIGSKLGHSYSKIIHEMLCGYRYDLCPLPTEEEARAFLTRRAFKAINVTIPYKRLVMESCSYIDPRAKAIGAVNTVVNRNGLLYGYNTDYLGFAYLADAHGVEFAGRTVLILGTGGTHNTTSAVAKDKGAARVLTVSRHPDPEKGELSYAEAVHSGADIVINTTPAGMYPNVGVCHLDVAAMPGLEAVLDVVYNPDKTELILRAEEAGVPVAVGGLEMLVAQAVYAAEYFLDRKFDDAPAEIRAITAQLRKEQLNVALIGMPSCGKTTIGRALADRLGKRFVDLDEEIVRAAGRSIPAYFLPAGIPCGLCLLLTAVSRYTLPALTVPLLVVAAVFAALLVGAYNGWRKEGIWLQNGRLTLRWQHGFHLHDICVLCPAPALTAMQSPWAAAVHRTNLTLTFPGGVKCRVRSVKCSELPFLLF